MKAGAAVLVVAAALAAGGAAAARMPTHDQRSAILAAFRSQQGDVAMQKVLVSTVDPGYASIGLGLHDPRLSPRSTTACSASPTAVEDPLDARRGGAGGRPLRLRSRRRRARPAERPLPACVAAAFPSGHARGAEADRPRLPPSNLTPYARNSTGLRHVCVSRANDAWAGGVARFESGAIIYVFFQHSGSAGSRGSSRCSSRGRGRPAIVLLSLASCVGYNPADYNA